MTKYQSQIAQVMFLWLMLGLAEVILNKQRSPQSLLVCAPPFVFYVNHYLLLIRRKWIAEVMIWILLIGILGIASLSTRGVLSVFEDSNLFSQSSDLKIENKKILVMSDDASLYLTNKTSTFFLEWSVFKKVFESPDVYQHVILVNSAFEKDPPEIIVDPEDYFKGILLYSPKLRQLYIKNGSNYYRRTKPLP